MKKITSTLLTVCISSFLLAQENGIKLQGAKVNCLSSRTNLPLQITFDQTTHLQDSQFGEWSSKELTKSNDLSLLLLKSERDELGFKHDRYLQYYKGYQIEAAVIIAHSKNNEVQTCNGDWYNNVSPSNSISLTEKQALQYALKKVNAKRYKWENEAEVQEMKEIFNDPNFSYDPKGEIILLPVVNELKQSVTYQYAYKFNIFAEEPYVRFNIFVDASSGNILRSDNLILDADVVGQATTKYSGQQPITCDSYNGSYRLRETGRGNGVETRNAKNAAAGGSMASAVDFTNTATNWNTTGIDQAATDAHWGAEMVYDFYKQTYNRNSIDNNGFKLLSYVHVGTNYVNAAWNGQYMVYGDGNTSQGFNIMTALDVCGHEIGHGLVSRTASLTAGGEPGALNEAFADILGTSVERFARPTQYDWLIGADLVASSSGKNCLRNTANPNASTAFEGPEADTYQGTYWDSGGEVHKNSTPCSHWFYILSDGKSGTNDINNAFNVSGIGFNKARDIAYRTLTVYMTPNSTYSSVRGYAIQAATDLYGACSNELKQTTNAWYAVGVGAQYTGGAVSSDFSSGGAATSCNLPTTINFTGTPGAQSYKWSFGDGAVSTSTNPAHTYTSNGTYSVKLVVDGSCGKDSTTKTSYITINAPNAPTGTGTIICKGNSANISATGNGNINWYSTPGGTVIATGNNYTTPTLTNTTTYYAVTTVTQTPLYGGPATYSAFGAGTTFSVTGTMHYQKFDVLQDCILKTVLVNASSAGNRVIELRNSAGTVIQSATVNIPTGVQTVTLNFNLTTGTDYQLAVGSNSTTINLWRNNTNTGATYPFAIGNLVNITGNDVGATYYYYFYNWKVQTEDCTSGSTPVTVTVNTCTGIEELSNSSLSLFPNPTADQLNLIVPSELLSSVKTVKLYDALGKNVKTISLNSEHTIINVSELAKGIYIVKLENSNGTGIVKRFVKE